jgi:hypothetical protein
MNITFRPRSKVRDLTALTLLAMMALNFLPSFSTPVRAAGGGTDYVHLHGGPSSNGSGTTNHDILLADCTDPTVYANLSLISEGKTFSGQAASNSSNFTFSDVPAHIFTLQGQAVPYYAQPVVYCQNSSEYGGYVTCDWFPMTFGPSSATGSIEINQVDALSDSVVTTTVTDGGNVSCVWFTTLN